MRQSVDFRWREVFLLPLGMADVEQPVDADSTRLERRWSRRPGSCGCGRSRPFYYQQLSCLAARRLRTHCDSPNIDRYRARHSSLRSAQAHRIDARFFAPVRAGCAERPGRPGCRSQTGAPSVSARRRCLKSGQPGADESNRFNRIDGCAHIASLLTSSLRELWLRWDTLGVQVACYHRRATWPSTSLSQMIGLKSKIEKWLFRGLPAPGARFAIHIGIDECKLDGKHKHNIIILRNMGDACSCAVRGRRSMSHALT
jgi:hypothetical protein